MRNLLQLFDWQYVGQIIDGDFTKFCGLLRIYELYYLPRPPGFLDLPKALLSNQMQRHVSLSPGELHLFLCALPDHEQF